MDRNQFYYGDDLAVLREHIKDESVDLICLDSPFNSRRYYDVLFAERDGTLSFRGQECPHHIGITRTSRCGRPPTTK